MRIVVPVLAVVACVATACSSAAPVSAPSGGSSAASPVRVVATGLENPYEIVWGPDDFIWATEKSGKRVTRIDPKTGEKKVALSLDDAVHSPEAQDGVLGLALHPDLLKGTGNDYVYVSYTYGTQDGNRTKIARYTYDKDRQTLKDPADVLTGLSSSIDHQSAKLRFGPDGKLYYTIGDQGANQFTLFCTRIEAQTLPTAAQVRAHDWSAYRGKVLRMNLDGSIPPDNPTFNGVRSHIYAYGFRNAQGLAFAPSGLLYSDEQGPKSDDELNLIEAGKNYGWPYVAGYQDDKGYVYGEWAASKDCSSNTYDDYDFPADVPQQKESDWKGSDFAPPLATFYTVDADYDFRTSEHCPDPRAQFQCWPTLALSSLEVHPSGTLLMTSLKEGAVYAVPLTDDGHKAGNPAKLADTTNRYRDTAFDPSGKTIYVATDNSGLTRDPTGTPTGALENPGAILAFTYEK
jgi:PQQ-dependent dehydrogenase (s-GDH family)